MDDCKGLSECEKCLAVIAHGLDALHKGNLTSAEASFRVALVLAQSASYQQAHDLLPLTLYSLSLLRHRQARADESRQLREQATTRLETIAVSMQTAVFQHLMATVLMDLGEYRRATPFCEQALQLEREWNDPVVMAQMLWRTGECYSRNGLKDHATIPLRAAVKIFRNHVGDPRLPAVLVTLGNALRKTAPAEAESCYREAADLHIAKMHLQSATPAWVNLGILCSEQGRYAESLGHYEKVLRVREQSPGMPLARIGTVLNNIANCYRRMGRFEEAFASVDRAIELLKPDGGAGLASAYGTRGLIFRDNECDIEAVEWLRNAYAEHQKLPSPNLESVAEDLENEIAALKRLGRPEEAALAGERLQSIRAAVNIVPQVNHGLGTRDAPTQGAVLVELNFGGWRGSADANHEPAKLAQQLSDAIETHNVGLYSGSVVIPESTTLMFHGADAEAIFGVLEPNLMSEPICAGARVTIRQLDGYREVILPSRLM